MFDENIKFKYSWRPYQEQVLNEVDKYLKDKKINIVAAPGSGKTILGLELARRLSNPVLILSPTVTIKNQWIDRFISSFMVDGSSKPDWISDNVYNLSYFNSITYQGLHYAYKKIKQINKTSKDETDDEIIEENLETDVNIKQYNLVAKIKKNKISTIILDEAHHLKSEWWQSLTKVIQELKDITIISLTATPPYDIEYSEWKKYTQLCGDIDIEISVPQLVQAKNLCPHQDYIYFSYPTKEETNLICKYENAVKDFINNLQLNIEFIEMIKNHPYIKSTDNYIENILENTEFFSSMLIFLNSCNIQIDKKIVNVLGHNSPIPKLSTFWIETLLQNILFYNKNNFASHQTTIEKIKSDLNRLSAIENNKISLSKNSTMQKYFINSLSKLNSINKIVEIEYNNLKNDLRMVILTDFLRKEYLFEENAEIKKIGVFPIFLNLLNSNINMAILTGSIFMIPNSKKDNLINIIQNNGMSINNIEFIPLDKIPSYTIVKTNNKNRNTLMKCISILFKQGDVNIIIGTKSLLGEGWDEPSINSLILASYVGSYVLSNQMRGRAIRTNDNPYKTSNIWHLVCITDMKNDIIKNADFEMLKRRFKSFVGIGYNTNVLENGIERLDIIPNKLDKNNINKYNETVINISNNRQSMYNRWFELIDEFGGENIKINTQLQTRKQNMKNKFSVIQPYRVFILMLAFILICYMRLAKNFIWSFKITLIFLILMIIYNIKLFIQCFRSIYFSIPKKQLKSVAKVVIKSLCDSNNIETNYKNIKIFCDDNKDNIDIELSIFGVTAHENNIIIGSLKELFSNTVNQRYIIINKRKHISAYYNVPSVLSTNKQNAQIFYSNWLKYIGNCELIYTKSIQGRKILLTARKNTFNYTDFDKFIEKEKPISKWQ